MVLSSLMNLNGNSAIITKGFMGFITSRRAGETFRVKGGSLLLQIVRFISMHIIACFFRLVYHQKPIYRGPKKRFLFLAAVPEKGTKALCRDRQASFLSFIYDMKDNEAGACAAPEPRTRAVTALDPQ